MGGHDFVIETKFDGERVQVHKDGDNIRLYTRSDTSVVFVCTCDLLTPFQWDRNANDCTSIYGPQLIPTIKELVKVRNCILDGELLIWDKLSERFEEFGKLKTYGMFNAPIFNTYILKLVSNSCRNEELGRHGLYR